MKSMEEQLRDAKEQGKKIVGLYCAYGPKELIIASGALSFGLCATKEEAITDGEKHLPRNFCPMIKSSYGLAITDRCPYFLYSDLVVGETTCDGKKKMFELMTEFKNIHVMRLPTTYMEEGAHAYWLSEVKRLKQVLEELVGRPITDDDLKEAIVSMNLERKLMQQLSEFMKLDPVPISGMDMLRLQWGRNFVMDRAEFSQVIQMMVDDVREKAEKKEAAFPKGAKRILVTGVPTGIGAEKVIDIIEECGVPVVFLESCSGMKPHMELVREDRPPLEAIAEKYLRIPCSCMSPNPLRLELYGPVIRDYKIDGVVDIIWQGCHTYNTESEVLRRFLQKEFNMPFLRIETDYSTGDREQIRTRVQAFLEMLP